MARPRDLSAMEVFNDNMADATRLLRWAQALKNKRRRSMRTEQREAFLTMRRMRRADLDDLDCVESDDLYIVLLPNGPRALDKDDFTRTGTEPLLRQSVVAMAAAVEGYVHTKTQQFLTEALDEAEAYIAEPDGKQPGVVRALKKMNMSLMDAMELVERQRDGKRIRWNFRDMLRRELHNFSSSDPDRFGKAFSMVGKRIDWKRIDKDRGLNPPKQGDAESYLDLKALAGRRNDIAHRNDRGRSKKATIRLKDVLTFRSNAIEIIAGIEKQYP